MPVYARVTKAQRAALERYEAITGLEPMYQDEFDAGEYTFHEMWNENIRLVESMLMDVTNTDLTGCGD